MFLAKKALTAFLVPPGCFVALLLLVGLLSLARRKRGAAWFCIGLAGLMWVASLPVASAGLFAWLEEGFPMPDAPEGDAVILLCGGAVGSAADLTGTGQPLPETSHRLLTALRLQKRLRVPLVVSGGIVYASPVAEAVLVRRICIDLGVAPSSVIAEDRSRDTLENARYTAEICRREGFKRPLLVTSGHHLRRAAACFAKYGIPVTPVPSSLVSSAGESSWRDVLPVSFRGLAVALHELFGWIFYKRFYGV